VGVSRNASLSGWQRAPTVNTRRLFISLLGDMRIDTVCDVGAMNGEEALAFRAAAPRARIYALEPNPHNFQRMQSDPRLASHDIRPLELAASNHDGEAEFYLVRADYSAPNSWRGMSSLYRRSSEYPFAGVERVKTTRLDTLLSRECPHAARIALWIDVEGAACEVLEGLSGVAERVQLLHVEVETAPVIGAHQKLYPEVKDLLGRLGFRERAIDLAPGQLQFNALFVRRELRPAVGLRVSARVLRARIRRLSGRLLFGLCPACQRRYQAALARRLH
jgi:FkbM family methyltransferase